MSLEQPSLEHQQRVMQLVNAALEQPPTERPAWLEASCGEDPALRREVGELLESAEQDSDFMEEPAFSVHARDPDSLRRIGPYRLVRLLGRGGMGAVYLATREEDFRQPVALKLIKRGMDTDEIIRRFQNERQILAELQHPNIARILDGGTSPDGRPYFAVEHVEGEPIHRYCDARKLSTHARLELFRKVCSAVHFAHQQLVVHCDLKPANILVDGAGEPKLLDFGIAKLLRPDRASQATAADRRPMTPEYASPEQVRGERVTTSSDVYSLGVLLYQLLTGHAPYRLNTRTEQEITRAICEEEPKRPSWVVRRTEEIRRGDGSLTRLSPETVSRPREGDPRRLRRRLAGDLDSIVLKAMRKEPRHRYGSVDQLSEDIRRHLTGRPVRARRGTFAYRAGKFVRRNKLALAVLVLIVGFSLTTTVLWRRAVHERDQAGRERARKEKMARVLQDVMRMYSPDETRGKPVAARDMLERLQEEISRELGDEPRLQAEMLEKVGAMWRALGLYEEARVLMEDSLRISREISPRDRPEVARRITNLGGVLFRMGKYDEAERLFGEAMEMRQRLGGDKQAVKSMNNIAAVLTHRGDYAGAERYYRRGLAIRRRLYDPSHPRIADSLDSLGALLYTRGDFAAAEALLHEALEIRVNAYGSEHTKVARVHNNLGAVLQAQGRLVEAELHCQQALAVRRQLLGEDHPATARTKRNLAVLLLALGETPTVEVLVSQVLGILRENKPAGDWEIADAVGVLGAYLTTLGRYAEAEPCLLESYRVLEQSKGPRATYTRDASRRLADLYQAWNRPQEAARYRSLAASSR
ncbi:MAG: serine/threonine protein kinase [bacterium]|nr:serine/threonine protein kinase [bacterium]